MSTKEQFLRDFNNAFANSDIDYISKFVADDIQWIIKGDDAIIGKSNFTTALKEMKADEPFELSIDNIIIHKNKGIVEGSMSSPDGKTYAFCDSYVFSDTDVPMINKMTSYVISLEKKPVKA
ncbi:nuclear transport factor 2 family protein [Fodinibius sp. Rm-B-1B1-1]|uniref:nuclear transport factor 2 family protein n=1 Tax=Fodinibius alkaliphilus TaxID=3140241 RepID=UPI00315A8114